MRTGSNKQLIGLTAASIAGAFLLAGCQGHGKYTQAHKDLAQQRMNVLKAGTEYEMAHQEFLAGNLDKAEKSVMRTLGLAPGVAKTHVLHGRILFEKNKLVEARDAFLRAEELEPDRAETQYYMGVVNERFGESLIAAQRYERALELEPENPQYIIAAAEMYIEINDLDRAEQLLQDHQDQFQYDPAVRQTFGHISLLRNDPARAVEFFKQARLLAPDDLQILEDLVSAQVQMRQFGDAEANLTRLLNSYQENERRDLLHMRARCLMATNRPVDARSDLIKLTDGPEGQRDLRAWIDLGSVSYQLEDSRRMGRSADRIIALAPEQYEGYFLKAAWYRMKGDTQKALNTIERAVDISHADPGPLVLQGLILKDMGRPEMAAQSFGAAIALDPSDTATRSLYEALTGQTFAGTEGDY